MTNQSIRIVSDGAPRGTKVFGSDGQPLAGLITGVSWAIDMDGVATATLTFALSELDVIADVSELSIDARNFCTERQESIRRGVRRTDHRFKI